MSFTNYLKLLVRRKTKSIFEVETLFHRCLNALDLTLLGLGSMLGAGLYIATGEIARSTAGPAIVVSLLIAAIPVTLSSLCYAEFGSRISRTGSSYTYTYFALGEIWAYVVGWNLLLENTIAAALLGHELSRFLNILCGGYIYKFFTENISDWHVTGLLPFPDFVAFAVVMIFTIVAAFGAQRSAAFIRVATLINLLVIVFVLLSGIYFVDTKNWSTMGKFAPYGFNGIMTGAASSYFSYLGFDILNTASEEAINPKRSIPFSCNISTFAGVLVYLLTAGVLTLMIPYKKLSPDIPLPEAFAYQGFPLGKYFVAVGGIFALTTSLLAYLFSGPRILYAMANDGLMFKFFGKISYKTQVPVRAVVFCGLTAGTVALFVDTGKLVEMLSIGTMLAYIMIAISVLLERYKPSRIEHEFSQISEETRVEKTENILSTLRENASCCSSMCFHRRDHKPKYSTLHSTDENQQADHERHTPTNETYQLACVASSCLVVGAFGFCLTVSPGAGLPYLQNENPYLITLSCLFGIITVSALLILFLQPRRVARSRYTVPFVPILPVISVVINEYLLTNLSKLTWASFAAWTFVGMAIYFIYGVNHSKEMDDENEHVKTFLYHLSPIRKNPTSPLSRSSEDFTPLSSHHSSDDEGFQSTMLLTSDDEKSPQKGRLTQPMPNGAVKSPTE